MYLYNVVNPLRTDNVYVMINDLLKRGNYEHLDANDKRALVRQSFIQYLRYLIYYAYIVYSPEEKTSLAENLDVNDLMNKLESIIPVKDHEVVLSPLIHYLLSLISLTQGWEAIWEVEYDLSIDDVFYLPIDDTYLIIKDNKVDALKTPMNCDYAKTFNKLYDYFMHTLVFPEEQKANEVLKKEFYE